jgi:hypothetical protein
MPTGKRPSTVQHIIMTHAPGMESRGTATWRPVQTSQQRAPSPSRDAHESANQCRVKAASREPANAAGYRSSDQGVGIVRREDTRGIAEDVPAISAAAACPSRGTRRALSGLSGASPPEPPPCAHRSAQHAAPSHTSDWMCVGRALSTRALSTRRSSSCVERTLLRCSHGTNAQSSKNGCELNMLSSTCDPSLRCQQPAMVSCKPRRSKEKETRARRAKQGGAQGQRTPRER